MDSMKKRRTSNLFVALGFSALISMMAFASYYPEKKYQENCQAFCDTLKPKHGFYDVKITKSYLPVLRTEPPLVNCYIQLKGFIYPRNTCREFAKGFLENVLSPSLERVDTIFIVYLHDSTIIEKYVFPSNELSE